MGLMHTILATLKVCSTDGTVRNVQSGSIVAQLEGCCINQQPVEDAFAVCGDVIAMNILQYGTHSSTYESRHGVCQNHVVTSLLMQSEVEKICMFLASTDVMSLAHHEELSAAMCKKAFYGVIAWSLNPGKPMWRTKKLVSRLYAMSREHSFVTVGPGGLEKISASTGETLCAALTGLEPRSENSMPSCNNIWGSDYNDAPEKVVLCAAVGHAHTSLEDHVFTVYADGHCVLYNSDLRPLQTYETIFAQLLSRRFRSPPQSAVVARFAADCCRVQLHMGKHLDGKPGELIVDLRSTTDRRTLVSTPSTTPPEMVFVTKPTDHWVLKSERNGICSVPGVPMSGCIGWNQLPVIITPIPHWPMYYIASHCCDVEGCYASYLVSADWRQRIRIVLPPDAAFVWCDSFYTMAAGELRDVRTAVLAVDELSVGGFEHPDYLTLVRTVLVGFIEEDAKLTTLRGYDVKIPPTLECAPLPNLDTPLMSWTSRVPVHYQLWSRAMYILKGFNV